MRAFCVSIFTALLWCLVPTATHAAYPSSNTSEHTVHYHNGTKQITYYTQGPSDGQALIFLHGWPGIAETWKYQVSFFASLGYYTITPDMPGYGQSSADPVIIDYDLGNIVLGLLAMLEDSGRTKAIWIGHDWGAGAASTLVATHPEVVEAMAWLSVPYRTVELGLTELLLFVNRTIYPENTYPYGQWDYMKYYEESYDNASAAFDSNIKYSVKKLFEAWNGNTSVIGTRTPLSHVRADRGWFGGGDLAVRDANSVPLSSAALDPDLYDDVVDAMNRTGFGPADAYYMNHERNRAHNLEQQINGGHLDIPCLYIQARYDLIVDTVTSDLFSPMPKHCQNLTFASVDAGHFLQLERPAGVNLAIQNWLVSNVTGSPYGNEPAG